LKTLHILQLSAVTARGIVIATSLALQEYAEKVAAALALRFLHCKHSELLDKAIKATLMVRKTESRSPALTDVDLFFQEVLQIINFVTLSKLKLLSDVGFQSSRSISHIGALEQGSCQQQQISGRCCYCTARNQPCCTGTCTFCTLKMGNLYDVNFVLSLIGKKI
jgi:hypothetical protein